MTATGTSHCFTVSPPKISLAFLLCDCLVGVFCVVWFVLFACVRDLLVLTAVG